MALLETHYEELIPEYTGGNTSSYLADCSSSLSERQVYLRGQLAATLTSLLTGTLPLLG
jgi:hypothetical protein